MNDTDDGSFGMGGPYRLDPDEEAFYARREQFVRAWREAHWLDTFSDPYICPLCNEAVQVHTTGYHDECVARHQQQHGKDWLDYIEIGERHANEG